jgi:DNA replication initiation complex subunit (GINS family)
MYDELYFAWRIDMEHSELGCLPSDFYTRIADYLRRIRENLDLFVEKNPVVSLLEQEQTNVGLMVAELVWVRYRKILKRLLNGKKLPLDSLAAEEVALCNNIMPSTEAYCKFAEGLLEGKIQNTVFVQSVAPTPNELGSTQNRVILRFLKQIPCIIGSDMKSYGPFLLEDIASIPLENSKILIKQGLAQQVAFT